ncbi:MAG: cytochrome c, partial [Planctomycetota bacterium]|nr:cytochrome c [Planctomycetota bacterium]
MIRALFAGLAVILVWFFDFPDARAMAEDGPALVQRLGCLRCHRWDGVKILEEGPSLDFAGDKLRPAWVDAFLQDPSGSRMPGNALSTEGRSQISRFLRTLREDKPRGRSGSGDPSRGEKLYEENRCGTCHPSEVDLSATPAKVRRDWLVDFLMNPQEAQPGARMPQYPLGRGEAEDLAAYLLVGGEPEVESDSSPAGLTAFLEAGCIACHRIGRVQGKELT